MKVPFSRLAMAALLLAGAISPVLAQDTGEPVARFENWDVHVIDGPDGKTCFIAARPTDSRPSNVTRSDIIFMITDWPTAGVQTEAHVEMGYPLATDVTVTIDNETTFTMTITQDEGAWLPTAVEDRLLTEAMQRGRTMVVTARSQRGTNTTDTYSLIGVTAALARSAQECS